MQANASAIRCLLPQAARQKQATANTPTTGHKRGWCANLKSVLRHVGGNQRTAGSLGETNQFHFRL